MYKQTLNSINRHYIQYIKKCIKSKLFRKYEMTKNICECNIAGKNVDFYLTYSKDTKLKSGYIISGFYYPTKYKVEIIIKFSKDFDFNHLSLLYHSLKSYLIHEIEHHLQNCQVPFREYLPIKDYGTEFEYITATSELEAFTKAMYYLHRNTFIPFKELIISESENVSTNPHYQIIFRKNIYNYLRKRKDLNIIQNIQL